MKAHNQQMNNKIIITQLDAQKNISYYSFTPKTVKTVLVLIHGISRNAEEIITIFSDLAEKNCVALVAPVFSEHYATDYQRLGRAGKGPRSDYQLFAILKDYKKQSDQKFDKFHMFGYSAGAQYAHRFAYAHPNMVEKIALAAAGWYSLPTTALPYPRGTRIKNQFTDISFEPNRYLRSQYRVYIGCEDNRRDESLNKNSKIDLTQGKNRITRAQNWIDLMQLAMQKSSIDNPIKLELLKGAGHDFIECVHKGQLHKLVINWIQEGKN